MENHRRALLKVCWAYGKSSHDRDDLLQEMASRLWASFGKYDSNRLFSTWMFRIALNVAIDWRRRQSRRPRETASLQDAGAGITDHSTEDDPRHEQLAEVHELMEQLGEADRAILLLHLEAHSHREIGEILGMSESNVGSRFHRIKNTLRQSVQGSPSASQEKIDATRRT